MNKTIDVDVTINCFYANIISLDEMAIYKKNYTNEDYKNAYEDEDIKKEIIECLDDFLGERGLEEEEIQDFVIDTENNVLSYDLVADYKMKICVEISPDMTVESYFNEINQIIINDLDIDDIKHFAIGMTDVYVGGRQYELDYHDEKNFKEMKNHLFAEKEIEK